MIINYTRTLINLDIDNDMVTFEKKSSHYRLIDGILKNGIDKSLIENIVFTMFLNQSIRDFENCQNRFDPSTRIYNAIDKEVKTMRKTYNDTDIKIKNESVRLAKWANHNGFGVYYDNKHFKDSIQKVYDILQSLNIANATDVKRAKDKASDLLKTLFDFSTSEVFVNTKFEFVASDFVDMVNHIKPYKFTSKGYVKNQNLIKSTNLVNRLLATTKIVNKDNNQ